MPINRVTKYLGDYVFGEMNVAKGTKTGYFTRRIIFNHVCFIKTRLTKMTAAGFAFKNGFCRTIVTRHVTYVVFVKNLF